MAELVVPRPAELGAGGVEVVEVTLHPHPVRDPGRGSHVVQRVPLGAGQDDAAVRRLLDGLVAFCNTDPRHQFVSTHNITPQFHIGTALHQVIGSVHLERDLYTD